MATATDALRDAIVTLATANGTLSGITFYTKPPSNPPLEHVVFVITEDEELGVDPTQSNQEDGSANRITIVDITVQFLIVTRMNEVAQDMGQNRIDAIADAIDTTFNGIAPSVTGWEATHMERLGAPSPPSINENRTTSTVNYTLVMNQ